MKKIHIIKLDRDILYAFVLGTGNFYDFIPDLEKSLHALKFETGYVVLDLILRHGLGDRRFMCAKYQYHKVQLQTICATSIDYSIEKLYDEYIISNQVILKNGLLSSIMQQQVIKILRDKVNRNLIN